MSHQQNNSYFYGKRNTSGRPKNAPNKVTGAVKETFALLLEGNLELLQDDIDQLKPYERIKVILELANYVIPKLRATDLQIAEQEPYKPIIIDMSQWK
jgi:hypothetical protein